MVMNDDTIRRQQGQKRNNCLHAFRPVHVAADVGAWDVGRWAWSVERGAWGVERGAWRGGTPHVPRLMRHAFHDP